MPYIKPENKNRDAMNINFKLVSRVAAYGSYIGTAGGVATLVVCQFAGANPALQVLGWMGGVSLGNLAGKMAFQETLSTLEKLAQ